MIKKLRGIDFCQPLKCEYLYVNTTICEGGYFVKAALVIGTRPQIIKSAPIIHAAYERSEVDLQVVHTGQHYDYEMSRVFFNELDLPDPIVNLGVGSGSHAWQTGKMMMGLEQAFIDLEPDVIDVPGKLSESLLEIHKLPPSIRFFHCSSHNLISTRLLLVSCPCPLLLRRYKWRGIVTRGVANGDLGKNKC